MSSRPLRPGRSSEAPDTVDLDLIGAVLREEIRALVPTVLLADVTRVHVQRVTAQETD
jgi:hypothetical protein